MAALTLIFGVAIIFFYILYTELRSPAERITITNHQDYKQTFNKTTSKPDDPEIKRDKDNFLYYSCIYGKNENKKIVPISNRLWPIPSSIEEGTQHQTIKSSCYKIGKLEKTVSNSL